MSTDENKSSREIERDVEHTRARMTETLDELKARMSPGQMLDEMLGYARDTGGGKMVQNLGRTIQDNPAPLLLIGAGVAWMMATGGSHGSDENRYPTNQDGQRDRPRAEGMDWKAGIKSVGDSVRHAGAEASSTIASMADATTGVVNDIRDSATRTMNDLRDGAHRSGESAYRRTREVGSGITSVLQDQPLIMGALGFALGAALGAALPETQAEDRLLGEASDALKEQAAKGYEKAKAVAVETFDKATEEAQAQGLSTEMAEDVVGELASKAGAVFETAREAAVDEASHQGLTDDLAKNRQRDGTSERSWKAAPID